MTGRPERGIGWTLLGLLAVFLLAFATRALGFERIISGDMVLFAPGDATYHVRRAFFTFMNFPAVLLFDPLLNYPDGAPVPWPPLFDFVLGGSARLLATDQRGFELVAAWTSPVYGSLTTIPIYAIGRRVASRTVAFSAATLFAFFPICVTYGRVGNPDHHAAVALVGACVLWLVVTLVDPRSDDRRLLRLMPLLVALRLTVFLIWHGNLLYIAMLEGSILLMASWSRRTMLVRVEFWSLIATALLMLPILAVLPIPIGGAYSSISLSRLHWLVVLGIALISGVQLLLAERRPESSFATRLACMVAVGAGFLALVMALPEPRAGIMPALRFATMTDGIGHITAEQSPLFPIWGREVPFSAERAWGWLHFLIPIAPFALVTLVREEDSRPAVWVLAVWGGVFGALAIAQRRFGNDLAPAAAVSFAVLLVEGPRQVLLRWVGGRGEEGRNGESRKPDGRWIAGVVSVSLVVVLLAPAIRDFYLPRARPSLAALLGDRSLVVPPAETVVGTLIGFARQVRDSTPETRGFLESDAVPEYGVIAEANLGHVLHYSARKGTATDPMWAFIGPENWKLSLDFLSATNEREALGLAGRLQGRYVVTMNSRPPGSVMGRLHDRDGRAGPAGPRLEHFRLITEAPLGAPGFQDIFRAPKPAAAKAPPYKLFEIVEGAQIDVRGEPGDRVEISVAVQSLSGREFVYRVDTRVGNEGRVRVRVPYSTDGNAPSGPSEPYRLRVGGRATTFEVKERDVLEGRSVPVGQAPGRRRLTKLTPESRETLHRRGADGFASGVRS